MKQNLPLYDTSSKKYGNNNFKRTVEADIAEKSQKTGQLTHTHTVLLNETKSAVGLPYVHYGHLWTNYLVTCRNVYRNEPQSHV